MVTKRTTRAVTKRNPSPVTGNGASGGSGGALLLDTYTGAAAAYSLRKLRAGYSGAAIRVRRSSDSAEQDVGFTSSGALDESSLTTFCGAGDGFVTTWYDQENSNDATQATAGNQPQIVSGGSVILENSRPVVSFLSGLSGLSFSTFAASAATMFMVLKAKADPPTAINSGFVKFGTQGGQTTNNHYPYDNDVIYDDSFSTDRKTLGNPSVSLDQLHLYEVLSSSSEWTARINASVFYTTASNVVAINISPKIGSNDSKYGMNNYIGEIVIYASDQSANRTGIESNVNDYWSVY